MEGGYPCERSRLLLNGHAGRRHVEARKGEAKEAAQRGNAHKVAAAQEAVLPLAVSLPAVASHCSTVALSVRGAAMV